MCLLLRENEVFFDRKNPKTTNNPEHFLQKNSPTIKHKKITTQPPKKTTTPKTTPALKIPNIGSEYMEVENCFTLASGFKRRNDKLLCNELMFHKKMKYVLL